jgi:hypothetical protein
VCKSSGVSVVGDALPLTTPFANSSGESGDGNGNSDGLDESGNVGSIMGSAFIGRW